MTFLDKPEINKTASSTVVRTFVYNHEFIYLKCVVDGIPEPTYKWNNAIGHEAGVKSMIHCRIQGLRNLESMNVEPVMCLE